MTTVKFRAWDTQAKQYVRIDSIQFDHLGNGTPFTLTTGGKTWAIMRFVLEQSTGLKDKNGREIYEGDIIEDPGAAPSVVTFSDGHFWADQMAIGHWSKGQVIGNIHENGELLK